MRRFSAGVGVDFVGVDGHDVGRFSKSTTIMESGDSSDPWADFPNRYYTSSRSSTIKIWDVV